MVLSIPFPWRSGFQIPFRWIRSRERSAYVLISVIWIVPVLRTTSPHHLLIRFWMSVRVARCSPSWTDFSGIIKYRLNLRNNITLHLFVLRERLHIKKFLLALKMPELHFSGKWPWFSTISSQLSKYFWMTSLLILVWECVIPITWDWYSKYVDTIRLD